MIWLKGVDDPFTPSSGLRDWQRPKINLECALKTKTAGILKECFHELFQVIITNEIPVTLLKAFIPIARHIRKGVLIRRIIGSRLCKAVGGQQFCKQSRKLQTRICRTRKNSMSTKRKRLSRKADLAFLLAWTKKNLILLPNLNSKRLNCFSCLTGSKHKYFTKIERIFNICIKLAELRTKIKNSPQPQVRNLNCQSPQVRNLNCQSPQVRDFFR